MYINTETLEWPISESEIKALHPNTSFPAEFIAPEPFAPIYGTAEPSYNPITQAVRQITPTVDQTGQWRQTWEVYTLEAEQVEANQAAQKKQLQDSVVQATQTRLDDFAKTRNYDGILSLATYATSTNPKFQAEGQYGVEARDATWAKLYEILSEVEAGTRPMPESYADVEPELPALEWPLA